MKGDLQRILLIFQRKKFENRLLSFWLIGIIDDFIAQNLILI